MGQGAKKKNGSSMMKRFGAATAAVIRSAVGLTPSQEQAVRKELVKLGLLPSPKLHPHAKSSRTALRGAKMA